MSNNKSSSSGVSFLGLLAIVFITLKLCGVITWSWWWVTAPLWGSLALALTLLIIGILLLGTAALIKHQRKERFNELYRSGK